MKNVIKKMLCLVIACTLVLTMDAMPAMARSRHHRHCKQANAEGNCIHLNNKSIKMYVTGSKQLKATAYGESSTVTWASSNTDVATVDANGKVTAIAVGSCKITATANDVTATCKVTVKKVSLKLNKTTKSMTVGTKSSLTANVFGPSKKVTWASDNTDIATVNSRGVIKALSTGSCNISATANGITVKCALTVKAASIKLNKTAKTIKVNGKCRLCATVKGKSQKVTWTSSNTDVATVSKRGVVRAKSAGTSTITATANGVSATCVITVEAAE